tara:strand:+ start:25 stop:510 length:486 start_codon:yes stop_codon:yes gene_type:complete
MSKQSNNIFLICLLIVISLALISVFIIEYVLGHEPCKLCVYQRIPYIIAILLIIKILFVKTYEKIILFLLFIIFLISLILAFYHFGIEQGFFNESVVCEATNLEKNLTKEDLLKQLKQSNISCKEVNVRILGMSLATINTIFSLVLSVIFFKLYKNYEKDQ